MNNKGERMNAQTSLPPRSGSRKAERGKAPKPKKRKKFRWGMFFLSLFLLVLLAAASFIGYLIWETKDAIGDISIDQIDIDASGGQIKDVPPAQSVKEKPTAMLLFGVDSRPKLGSLNTDVLMVAAFNPNTKSAVVVSIPRDTRIDLDGYKVHKANAYYARFYQSARSEGLKGDAAELDARRELKQLFGLFFGIPIDYSAKVNFQGFSDVVDALGGIEVNVDQNMKYVDNADGTVIDLRAGLQTLNGDQALDFVRYRKSNNGETRESSDFERNTRQTEVVGALIDKMKSLGGISKLGSVIDAVGNNLSMDMPSKEIERLMVTYFGISRSDIQFIPLEGTWRSPYVYLDEAKLAEAKAALQAKLEP